MLWGQMITKSLVFDEHGLLNYSSPSILGGVSSRSALVAGNGSYILAAYGHDLHGPTVTSFLVCLFKGIDC